MEVFSVFRYFEEDDKYVLGNWEMKIDSDSWSVNRLYSVVVV